MEPQGLKGLTNITQASLDKSAHPPEEDLQTLLKFQSTTTKLVHSTPQRSLQKTSGVVSTSAREDVYKHTAY
jgi:hypothetical protein